MIVDDRKTGGNGNGGRSISRDVDTAFGWQNATSRSLGWRVNDVEVDSGQPVSVRAGSFRRMTLTARIVTRKTSKTVKRTKHEENGSGVWTIEKPPNDSYEAIGGRRKAWEEVGSFKMGHEAVLHW